MVTSGKIFMKAPALKLGLTKGNMFFISFKDPSSQLPLQHFFISQSLTHPYPHHTLTDAQLIHPHHGNWSGGAKLLFNQTAKGWLQIPPRHLLLHNRRKCYDRCYLDWEGGYC